MTYPAAIRFAAVPLAAIVFSGLAASAQAFGLPSDYKGYQAEITRDTDRTTYDSRHHPCHGHGAGTANRACGTRTGGPVGGLH